MVLIFHEKSPILRFANDVSFGTRFAFSEADSVAGLTDRVFKEWFLNGAYHNFSPFHEERFEQYTAKHLTTKLSKIFDAASLGKKT